MMILAAGCILLPIFVGILGSFLHVSLKRTFLLLQGLFLATGIYLNFLEKPMQIVFGHREGALGVALRLDGFSGAFMAIFAIFMVMIALYEWQEMMNENKKLLFLFLLQGIFAAFLWSDDLFNMFVLIEAITLISSILIAIEKRAVAMEAAVFYLLFNTFSIFFFLIGVVWLYHYTGHLSVGPIREMLQNGDTEALKIPFALMMTALGIKSAMFPLYTWLPKAHAIARTSVSALLSGVLVKTGLYAFSKIFGLFSLPEGEILFILIGAVTAIMGALFALKETDIKRILAFHTVSQLGWVVAGFAMGPSVEKGPELFLLNHALFKGALFLVAGLLMTGYGTRDITKMKGLYRQNKMLSFLLLIFVFAITGFPLLGGYLAKSLILKGVGQRLIFKILFELAAFLTVLSFWKFIGVLGGKSAKQMAVSKKMWALWVPAFALILNGVFLNGYYAGQALAVGLRCFIKWGIYMGAGFLVYRFLLKPYGAKLHRFHYEMGFETAMISAFLYFSLIVLLV